MKFEELSINYDIVFWLFMLFNLFAFALVRTRREAYFTLLGDTFINNRHLVQNLQEGFKQSKLSSILFSATYFTSMGCLISFFVTGSFDEYAWQLTVMMIGLFLLKWVAMESLAFFTQTKFGIQEHFYNHTIYFQIVGLISTLFLVFIHYLPESTQWYVSIVLAVLIGMLLFIREMQSLVRATKSRIPPLYIILYLCTLELLPTALLAHLLISNL